LEVVPGDILSILAGDVINADLRLISCDDLHIDEALLTGENEPVEKTTDVIEDPDVPVGDRTNLAFMGSNVVKGSGTGIVIASGMNTEIGRIAKQLNRGKLKSQKTDLQKN